MSLPTRVVPDAEITSMRLEKDPQGRYFVVTRARLIHDGEWVYLKGQQELTDDDQAR